jgi:hypothetical protein
MEAKAITVLDSNSTIVDLTIEAKYFSFKILNFCCWHKGISFSNNFSAFLEKVNTFPVFVFLPIQVLKRRFISIIKTGLKNHLHSEVEPNQKNS